MTLIRSTLALMAALGPATLPSCTPFPDVGTDASSAALAQPYPKLVPLDGLDTRLASSRIAPDTAPTIEARVAGLKARAGRLRGDVVDPATRSRMRAGVQE
ncbi:hypothetical protein ACEWPM_015840 [Roseovarius sp. S4756]|uniref:hypothetical protein n=1 Tax=Roseovarius maritimus TaxID=3342637 RepID=UPI00372A2CEF